jgi:DNA repair exonuclease SbcCD ATPase subunit
MLENINKKITEIEENLRKRREFSDILEQKQQELSKAQTGRRELSKALNKKERQIKRLQSPSVIGLIFRREDIDLQEELRQYDIIKSEYENCADSITDIEKDINFYKEQIENYHSLDSDYDDLIRERQDLILSKNDSTARELRGYLDEISEKESSARSIREGISACNRALPSLARAIGNMESARSWGIWDIMGGGFLSTAVKHSRIDNMRQEIKGVEREIRALNTNLSYINLPSDMDIEIGGFATFADYFFDGLFADLFVQGKIKDSLNKLRDTYDKINRIKDALQTKLEVLNRELRDLRDKADNLERNI